MISEHHAKIRRHDNKRSIYHPYQFGGKPAIRLNMVAVKRLLPEFDIDGFDLPDDQVELLQRRVSLYVDLGGRLDFCGGAEAKPEIFIPARVIPAKPRHIRRGKIIAATRKQIIPAKLEPAKPEIEPSIENLPSKEIVGRVVCGENAEPSHPTTETP